MTSSSPGTAQTPPHGEEPGADLVKRVAMEKAGIFKAATQEEVQIMDTVIKAVGEESFSDMLTATKRYINEVERVYLVRNGVLLIGVLPIAMVIRDSNNLTWSLLIIWIVIGSKALALTQTHQRLQIENVQEEIHKLREQSRK